MATMKQAIKEAFEQSEGALSKEVIRQFVDERYPGIWQPSTLTAHLYACAINNPKSYIHHPHAKRFPLQETPTGTFELYDEGSSWAEYLDAGRSRGHRECRAGGRGVDRS